MGITLENYEDFEPTRELTEIYNTKNFLEHLVYGDKDKLIVNALLHTYDQFGEKYFSWETDIYNQNGNTDHVRILANNLTYINMKQLTKKVHTTCISYETSTNINKKSSTYSIILTSSDDKVEITVNDIPANYIAKRTQSSDLVTLTIKEPEVVDGPIIKHYLFNNGLYFVINEFDNTETYYVNDQTIKYQFEHNKLSHSEFLLYHNPIKATFYESNKEYIMKYDNKGIMTSMIEVSDPETDYCQYKKEVIEKLSEQVISIHPNIYDKFNIYYINPNFLSSKEQIVEGYTKDFALEYFMHTTDTILVD